MFIFTAKLPRRSILLFATAAALALCLFVGLKLEDGRTSVSSMTSALSGQKVHSNQDRINYLKRLGWEVEETPSATEEMKFPDTFDDSYHEFLLFQAEQGFDLTPLAGKRVKRYSYRVLNHPSGEERVLVRLLVCRHRVVGGEVLSPTVNGLHHGLARP